MLSHEEKLNLIHALIHSGVNSAEQITCTIQTLEEKVFQETTAKALKDTS